MPQKISSHQIDCTHSQGARPGELGASCHSVGAGAISVSSSMSRSNLTIGLPRPRSHPHIGVDRVEQKRHGKSSREASPGGSSPPPLGNLGRSRLRRSLPPTMRAANSSLK